MTDEQYGTSPLLAILDDLKAYNALPLKERTAAARAHVEKQMLLREIKELLSR